MLKLAKLAALVMVSALMTTPAFSADKAAATVNGVAISQSRLDMSVQAASRGQPETPDLRQKVLDNLIAVELLSQEAAKKGLEKQPDVLQQLELVRKEILADAFVQDYNKNHPISEDTLKQEYESLKAKLGNKVYKVAHIVVRSEDEAKAIEAQLKKKGNFAKIAKEKSTDPSTATKGGDLGAHKAGEFGQYFGQPFADAVAALKKDQVSAPVKSQFGWHIIKLTDVQDWNMPPFEQVKPDLMQHMQQQNIQKAIADLRKSAKVE